MGNMRYCKKCKVEDFVKKKRIIPIRNIDYHALCCFDNIYYSTTVDRILDTGEHK